MGSSLDERIVGHQIGRTPKPFDAVCRRCRYEYPQVIRNHPAVPRGAGFEVFPTIHWLTCPLLHRAISRLEAEGQIRQYEERLEDDAQFLQRMEAAHATAAEARVKLVPESIRRQLQQKQPRQWRALAETGVAGIREATGVKCLHAHYADYVGGGTNPIGREVDEQLRQRGVALDGDAECWRHCAVEAGAGVKASRMAARNGTYR